MNKLITVSQIYFCGCESFPAHISSLLPDRFEITGVPLSSNTAIFQRCSSLSAGTNAPNLLLFLCLPPLRFYLFVSVLYYLCLSKCLSRCTVSGTLSFFYFILFYWKNHCLKIQKKRKKQAFTSTKGEFEAIRLFRNLDRFWKCVGNKYKKKKKHSKSQKKCIRLALICVPLMMLVHTRGTLTYACMLVGQFFHTVPQPASPPLVFCQRLRFPSSPLSHLLHDGSSSGSSPCLLFFPSGGERANKQNQQNWIPCACMCQCLPQCVDSEGSCTSLSCLSEQFGSNLR